MLAASDIVSRALAKVQTGGASLLYDPDPVIFARRLGFEPDEWQKDFLRAKDSNILLNCSRQSGKSTSTAILALWTAIGIPDSLILLYSPSLRQSQELFRKIIDFHADADIDTDEENRLSMRLINGSRIVSLPGTHKTTRGFSAPRLIVIDEASQAPDDLYFALVPMLATVPDGRMLMLSTPFGRRGFWWEAWERGGDYWRRFEITAAMCPRISPEFLENARATMSQFQYEQEFFAKFHDAETAAFSHTDILAAAHGEVVESWKL